MPSSMLSSPMHLQSSCERTWVITQSSCVLQPRNTECVWLQSQLPGLPYGRAGRWIPRKTRKIRQKTCLWMQHIHNTCHRRRRQGTTDPYDLRQIQTERVGSHCSLMNEKQQHVETRRSKTCEAGEPLSHGCKNGMHRCSN